MKVIVAGASGLVGRHIVAECIANDAITHAYILTRRAIPETNPKVTVLVHDDFTQYPASLLDKMCDADACLWAIGGRVFQFADVEACRRANVDCTLAAATAFKAWGRPQFRFVFCSGSFTEWDQDARLLFLNDSRKIKGQVEKGLSELQEGGFKAFCVRPSGILDSGAGLAQRVTGVLFGAIGADVVARGMVRVALGGYKREIVTNAELKRLGIAGADLCGAAIGWRRSGALLPVWKVECGVSEKGVIEPDGNRGAM